MQRKPGSPAFPRRKHVYAHLSAEIGGGHLSPLDVLMVKEPFRPEYAKKAANGEKPPKPSGANCIDFQKLELTQD